MFKTFITSQKVKNTYRVNNIIFSLKQIPLIKKILPSSLYKNKGLKIFASIISILMELSTTFFTKPLYIMLVILLPSIYMGTDTSASIYMGMDTSVFLRVFTFLTIAGTVLNCHFFEASKHKYYAISLLKMDVDKYILSNYFYFLLKILIGMTGTFVIIGLVQGINIYLCLLLPLFVIASKVSVSAFLLYKANKTDKVFNEDKPTPKRWAFIIICIVVAYLGGFVHLTINPIIFVALAIITIIIAVPAGIYIVKFKEYEGVFKRLLDPSVLIINVSSTVAASNQIAYAKQIDMSVVDTKGKKGYAYFNDIFVKRHRKLISRSARNTTLIAAVLVVGALIGVFISSDFSDQINTMTLTWLPYFLFIMYFINRGQQITTTMFMNCDKNMLTYRFYRQPADILALFTLRLKTIVKLNLMPAGVIAAGLPLLLYFSGGTDNILNYFVLTGSILAMSVFFSAHYLIIYYLLQPYNNESKTKSSTYGIVNSVAVIGVFFLMNLKLPTLWFGLFMIIFMVVYTSGAIFLAYKLAPKTFKLR